MSIHLLRTVGPEVLQYRTNPEGDHGDYNTRSEIELACEECLLREGPDFLLGLFMDEGRSVEYVLSPFLQATIQAT